MVSLEILQHVANSVYHSCDDWGDCSVLYTKSSEMIDSPSITPENVRCVWEGIVVPAVMRLNLSASVAECMEELPNLMPELLATNVPTEHIEKIAEIIPRSGLVVVMQAVVVVRGFPNFARGIKEYGHSDVWLHMLLSDLNSQDADGFQHEALSSITDINWTNLLKEATDFGGFDKVGWYSTMGTSVCPRILSPSLECSSERFAKITGGMLSAVFATGNFVVAGGSVLRSLSSQETLQVKRKRGRGRPPLSHEHAWKESDIDVFLVLPQEQCESVHRWHERAATRIQTAITLIVAHIQNPDYEGAVLLLTDAALTLTWVTGSGRNKKIHKIQFVLCVRNTIAEILNSFDVDSCCFATDGKRFFAPERGMRALRTGANIIDPIHKMVPTRFAKYFERGFKCMLHVAPEHQNVVQEAKNFCEDNKGDASAFEEWRKDGGLSSLLAWNHSPKKEKTTETVNNNFYTSCSHPHKLLHPACREAFLLKHPAFHVRVFEKSSLPCLSDEMISEVSKRMHQGLMGKRINSEDLLYKM